VTVTFIFHTPRRISLQAEDPAAASGSGQITTESGSIHSLVWLLTYSAFLLPHNTASTLSEPGQSLIRFGRVPGAKTSLFPWQPQPFYAHQPVRGIRKHAQCAGVSGFSSAVASGQKAHSKRALPHGRQQIPHAVAGHDAVADGNIQKTRGAAKMSGESLAFSTSSPVKIGVSGGKFQPPVRSRSNKAAGISVRPLSTGGMWRSQVSCCRIVPWTRPWLPGCVERLRSKPGMAHHVVCEQQYLPDWPSERATLSIASIAVYL
jgi:hypothetical protein